MDSFLSKDSFRIPPYPISDVSVSTIKLAFGFIRDEHGIDLTRALIFWTILVCSSSRVLDSFLAFQKWFANESNILKEIRRDIPKIFGVRFYPWFDPENLRQTRWICMSLIRPK